MDPLWLKVCDLLRWHSVGMHTPIQTLNRLWRKQPYVKRFPQEFANLPELTESMLSVREESWMLETLLALTDSTFHQRAKPKAFPPIIVLERTGRDFLMDGGNRLNYWRQRGDAGPHAVLKIVVRED